MKKIIFTIIRSIFAILAVILIAAAGALLSLCISSKADIAAVHAAIVNEEAQVLALEQENTRMKTELEQKSSQKAVESYRISDEQKVYLRSLKVKPPKHI